MAHNKEQIDHLFKKELSRYTPLPSGKVWRSINASLSQQGAYQGFWALHKAWILSAAAILIFSLGGVWLFTRSRSTAPHHPPAIVQHQPLTEKPKTPNNLTGEQQPQTPSTSTPPHSQTPDSKQPPTPREESTPPLYAQKGKPSISSTSLPPATSSSHLISPKEEHQTPLLTNDSHPLLIMGITPLPPSLQQSTKERWMASNSLKKQQHHAQKEVKTNLQKNKRQTLWNNFSQAPHYLCIGLSASPEYLFEKEGQRNAGIDYGLEFYYNKSDFIFRSGIHLARYGDKGEYNINYERIDSLGYIYTVESFTVDPNNPDSIIFKMDIEGVYDSVQISEKKTTDAYYSYLRIPIMAGYTITEKHNFSLDLTGGPVFNLLIKSHNPHPAFPNGENIHKKEIEDQSIPWIKTNIQLRAALALHYRFSNHLRFTFEPTYNYFINPIYSQGIDPKGSPFSLGARFGLLYKL
ncbi:MAG: hypothetical protein CSA95_01360 [Bacteroidetes bacterium]|nr:MAG: hypothetical protein CSA95_01360 [Bacteroidota bacterium]PIE88205.1 MAG: hypothetical protein CSA04_03155 [Bacteroidota bacterium]